MSASHPEKEKEDVDATGTFEVKATAELEELEKQHEGLLAHISTLKEDVRKWQHNIETEAQEHSQELDKIRSQLRGEVESLRTEFEEIRQKIKEQMAEDTAVTPSEVTAVDE